MKIITYLITISFQLLSVWSLKLLDSFSLIIVIFISCVIGGFFLKRIKSTTNLGWGLFFGSLTSLVITIGFTIWLSFNLGG
ncbi:hypothetical protein [Fulvivirga lutimaris]|uniref:hypothetical protein n=1 Tax=Fulvivirga lutimaris TaxID=1819566 RepID=UPI0012BBD753|nr:hypothetical protein [Fulvivirga lutimaris]MTI41088.1 hypothetical protein [Fulvivirga lutimaris]